MRPAFKEKIIDILSRCNDMTIATVRPDGAPQATVVSFVHDGLLIYFGTGATAQKAENIHHDHRVSITATAPYADWLQIEGLSLAGHASEVKLPGEKKIVAGLMAKRFAGISVIDSRDIAAVRLFRVRPTLVSILDYAQGFGHTDLVTIGADDIAESRGSARHAWATPALT